jgi:hypothetical protein
MCDSGGMVPLQSIVSIAGLNRRLALAGRPPLAHGEALVGDSALQRILDDWIEECARALVQPLVAVNLLINPGVVLVGGRLPMPLLERLTQRANLLLRSGGRDAPAIAPVMPAALAEDARRGSGVAAAALTRTGLTPPEVRYVAVADRGGGGEGAGGGGGPRWSFPPPAHADGSPVSLVALVALAPVAVWALTWGLTGGLAAVADSCMGGMVGLARLLYPHLPVRGVTHEDVAVSLVKSIQAGTVDDAAWARPGGFVGGGRAPAARHLRSGGGGGNTVLVGSPLRHPARQVMRRALTSPRRPLAAGLVPAVEHAAALWPGCRQHQHRGIPGAG